ncbi:MAG TPA: Sec-independent protein translocase protein TatB [Xanthobacteraceae bacterium]
MFDFSWSELLLIGIVALIFIGPKELPGVLRTLGQWMSKVRRMASEFQNQFHDAMREAELADLKKDVDEMAAKAANYSNFDPLADVRKDMEAAQREIESAVAGTPAAEPPALAEATATVPPTSAPPTAEPATAEPAGVEAATEAVPHSPAPTAPADAPAREGVAPPVKHGAGGSEPA